jgi:hypothetical protein
VLPIALGTVLGVLGLLIIALAVWFCRRRQKRPVSEAWTVAGHSYPGSSQITSTVTSPRSTVRLDDSIYANNPAYYQPAEGWRSDPQYGNMDGPTAPPPIPMSNNSVQVYNSWADTMLNAPARPQPQSVRRSAAIIYQPNRLSTITEKSTPPIGGGSSLANSPASQPTDIYHDTEEGGSDRRTSLPSVNDSRSGPSAYPTQQPHLRRDSRNVATGSQQSSVSTSSVASPALRVRPPAYTPDP